ncbi:hypothetical protein [Campylobacter sp. US33a]|uniref:hypothetical protein n=1 Tax=Campylobacter sp. US33a TaxID=2498120 RepID=UPI001067340C|nr:hypothetical protein [Campylobacter sp. US33a]TEY00357.1 hypothetical protein ELQ16_09240 [Campylobacter sp. US33a]
MSDLMVLIDKGGVIAVLTIGFLMACFIAYELFKKFDKTQSILNENKNFIKKGVDTQERMLNELKVNNQISKAQLESSNKIIELHSKLIGDKLDNINHNINELKFEIKRYENSELMQMMKGKD